MLLVAMVQSSSDSIAMLFTSSFLDDVTFSILRHMVVCHYRSSLLQCCAWPNAPAVSLLVASFSIRCQVPIVDESFVQSITVGE